MHTFKQSEKQGNGIFLNFLPAVLKKNKSAWVIEYYAENPIVKKLQRKRIKVEHIRKRYNFVKDAVKHINMICFDINNKLLNGWTPFIDNNNARLYSNFSDIQSLFLKEKQKELRPATMRSYQSQLKKFIEYLKLKNFNDFSGNFKKNHAVLYLDYLYNTKNLTARTYNNALKFMRAFFSWCLERGYVSQNPFTQIKVKPKTQKKRILIDAQVRKQIADFLLKENPRFLIVCKLMYISLLPPNNEIRNIRVGDVDFIKGCVRISENHAKNHKQRFAPLTHELINDLQYIKQYPPDFFIFGHDFIPAKTPVHESCFTKLFIKYRKKLNLDKNIQFYSFRDSGITEYLHTGTDPLSVMQIADHSSLAMTTIYADHYNPKLIEQVQKNAPAF